MGPPVSSNPDLESNEDLILDELWATRYRCFCGCTHLRTAAAIICFVDFIMLTVPFLKGLSMYIEVKSNPVATGWFISTSMVLVVSMLAIVCSWFGLWREQSLWLIPKLVFKVFTIVLCVLAMGGFGILVFTSSPLLINVLTNDAHIQLNNAQSAVKLGGSVLITIMFVFTGFQLWFLLVLYDSYRYVRSRELQRKYIKVLNGQTYHAQAEQPHSRQNSVQQSKAAGDTLVFGDFNHDTMNNNEHEFSSEAPLPRPERISTSTNQLFGNGSVARSSELGRRQLHGQMTHSATTETRLDPLQVDSLAQHQQHNAPWQHQTPQTAQDSVSQFNGTVAPNRHRQSALMEWEMNSLV